jgi:hypothetical protein
LSIPLPGASFLYSLLKDGVSWLRGRRLLRADAFRRWTVDQWYQPEWAVDEFVDPDWLRQRAEAYRECTKAWDTWANGSTRDEALYEEAKRKLDSWDGLIREALNNQLVRGELVARGFREPFSHGASYLTISRHEWRIIKVEWPDRATGGGVTYIGVTIGKPGTKRFFSRSVKAKGTS